MPGPPMGGRQKALQKFGVPLAPPTTCHMLAGTGGPGPYLGGAGNFAAKAGPRVDLRPDLEGCWLSATAFDHLVDWGGMG